MEAEGTLLFTLDLLAPEVCLLSFCSDSFLPREEPMSLTLPLSFLTPISQSLSQAREGSKPERGACKHMHSTISFSPSKATAVCAEGTGYTSTGFQDRVLFK